MGKYNDQLEEKKRDAMAKAAEAMKDVENLSFKNYEPSFLKNDKLVLPFAEGSGLDLKDPRVGPEPDEMKAVEEFLRPLKPEPAHPTVTDLQPRMMSTKVGRGVEKPGASANEVETLQNTIRFQKSRILALQEELDRCIRALASRDEDNKGLSAENKRLTEENKRVAKEHRLGEAQVEKHKKQISTLEGKTKEFEKDLQQARRENDELSLQIRKQSQEIGAKESRVNRLIEDCERYRSTVKDLKSVDTEQASQGRREVNQLLTENRKLERQRNELVASFKKQMKLIDILKKQRTHLEAARVLSFTEDEFVRVLDLGDKLASAPVAAG